METIHRKAVGSLLTECLLNVLNFQKKHYSQIFRENFPDQKLSTEAISSKFNIFWNNYCLLQNTYERLFLLILFRRIPNFSQRVLKFLEHITLGFSANISPSTRIIFTRKLDHFEGQSSIKFYLVQVFSCDFCKVFKNTFSYRTSPMVASYPMAPDSLHFKARTAVSVGLSTWEWFLPNHE